MNQTGAILEFRLDGPTGSTLWLNNIDGLEVVNGDFQLGDLSGWIATVSDNGSVEVVNVTPTNQPPVADAGSDETLECAGTAGASVVLNGTNSADPDGDQLSYSWTGPFGALPGATVEATLPLGTHSVTLTVDDGNGGMDSDTIAVTVQDSDPPGIGVSVSPDTLWPPNHKLVQVTTTVTAPDSCDANPVVSLASITMNEGDETITYDPTAGNGNNTDDIVVKNGYIFLRAERKGSSSGRTYTIAYTAKDDSGNTSNGTATVIVPHNK